jgi:hypothetical protein
MKVMLSNRAFGAAWGKADTTSSTVERKAFGPAEIEAGGIALTSKQLALLILAAMCGPGVQVACERALSLERPLLTYLTRLVDKAWESPHDAQFDFGSLRIDLITGSASIIEQVDGELTTKNYGPPASSNNVSRTIQFATIRDVVCSIRSSRTRRVFQS